MMILQGARQFVRRGSSIYPFLSRNRHVAISQQQLSISCCLRSEREDGSKTSVSDYVTKSKHIEHEVSSTEETTESPIIKEVISNITNNIESMVMEEENLIADDVVIGSSNVDDIIFNIDELIMTGTGNLEDFDVSEVKQNITEFNAEYHKVPLSITENMEDFDVSKAKPHPTDAEYHSVPLSTTENMEDFDVSKAKPHPTGAEYHKVPLSTTENMEDFDVSEAKKHTTDDFNADDVIMSTTENMEDFDVSDAPEVIAAAAETTFKEATSGQATSEAVSSGEAISEEDYDEQQTDDDIRHQILSIALDNVSSYGWTKKSIDEAVRMLELSPSASGLFKRGAVDLVLFFIEEGNNALIDHLAKISKERDLSTEEARAKFIEEAVKLRLKMIIPYIDSWPEAMQLLASPAAVSEVFENGANLMDEIWYHAGDMTTDMSWYAKRAALAAINVSAELFMLTDRSPEYADTWEFLHRRLQDARALNSCKISLDNAANDAFAIASAGLTTAQNMLGIGSKRR